MQALRWLVSGHVQGVGFRWFVLRAARACGVEGDVRNLRDGRVEVRVRGTAPNMERLLEEIRQGPSSSRVDRVEETVLDEDVTFHGFDVRY